MTHRIVPASRRFPALLLALATLPLAANAEPLSPPNQIAPAIAPLAATAVLGAVVDVRRPDPQGMPVLAITPGGPADIAGLQVGDRLLAINGQRLDTAGNPASVFERFQSSDAQVGNLEILRDGQRIVLSATTMGLAAVPATLPGCGYVSARQGVVPINRDIHRVEITRVDGRSTPLSPVNRHQVDTGKHVLVVRELIPTYKLTNAQIIQINRMKNRKSARAYKTIVVDVAPDTSYRVGARLLRDRLDSDGIRDNAYWEPVVWSSVREACR